MKNKEKPEILIPRGYAVDEMLDLDGDLWDEKPIGVEEVKTKVDLIVAGYQTLRDQCGPEEEPKKE